MIKGTEVGQGWWLTQVFLMGGLVQLHVHPVEDVREHELHNECWCKPTLFERINNAEMVTHKSAEIKDYE